VIYYRIVGCAANSNNLLIEDLIKGEFGGIMHSAKFLYDLLGLGYVEIRDHSYTTE